MPCSAERSFWEGYDIYLFVWTQLNIQSFWSSRCLGVIGQQLGSRQKTLGDNLPLPCSDMIIMHSYPAVILLIGWQSSTKEPEFISNGEAHLQTCSTYTKEISG